MKLLTFSLVFSILLTGCGVSAFKPKNWITSDSNDTYRSKSLELCRHQAQKEELKRSFNSNESIIIRSTNRYDNYNKQILISCMEEKGYVLRDLTGAELLLNTVTAPIVLPILISGRNFDDTY